MMNENLLYVKLKQIYQGRSQELEMGGAKLLGEGFGGRLRPPVGPGQSHGRGPGGPSPPEALGF